jgi:hypothetical protein
MSQKSEKEMKSRFFSLIGIFCFILFVDGIAPNLSSWSSLVYSGLGIAAILLISHSVMIDCASRKQAPSDCSSREGVSEDNKSNDAVR